MFACGNLQYPQAKWKTTHRAFRYPMWYCAFWNVRSLIETDGPVETVRQCPEAAGEDKLTDLVIRELCRYQVSVGILQETKWVVCRVRDSIFLAAIVDQHNQLGKLSNKVRV